MNRATKRLVACLTFTGIIALGGCDSGFVVDPLGTPGDPAFSLSPSEMTLAVGENAKISATLVRANGEAVNPQALKWESTDPSRASVDRDGVVTGHAPGTPAIVATSGKMADTTWIRIVEQSAPRAGVNISPDSVVLRWLDATATLAAEVLDEDGTLVAAPGLTWKSLNPGIAQTDGMGVITAKGVGVALIVATAGCCERADTAYARIHQVVYEVAIEQESVTLSQGSSVQLQPVALDRGGATIEDVTFAFKSANESVAKVSSSGVVMSQSAGTTTVTATSGDHVDLVTVTVTGDAASAGPRADRYPNEPAGYAPWFEHDWQSWPNGHAERMPASVAGMIKASDSESDAATAFVLVNDPSAPHGKGNSLRHRQRKGQTTGTTSGVFDLFHPKAGTASNADRSFDNQVKLRSVYRSHWVYFEPHPVTGDWQFGNQHMRTFWWNRFYGGGRANIGLRTPADPTPPNRHDHFRGASYWFYPYEGATASINYTSNVTLSVGVWYHYEYLWETEGRFGAGNNGLNDSRIRIWIDGKLVTDTVATHFIDRPFANDHFAMVWLGGSGAVRDQDDFIRFGDIYISGVPY